jgi:hypothetical protein
MGIVSYFGWEIPTITNEAAAWFYVIANMNNKLMVLEQSERSNRFTEVKL